MPWNYQAAVDDVVMGIKQITQFTAQLIKENLTSNLANDGKTLAYLDERQPGVPKIFEVDSLQELSTTWLRKKYFKEHFGLLEPEEVCLGTRYVVNSSTRKVDKIDSYGYFVPFIKSLEQLVQMPEVKLYMSSENVNEHEFRTDFIDGKYLMEHDVFRNRSAIKIIAFFDDIEVVNPIGVKNKKTN